MNLNEIFGLSYLHLSFTKELESKLSKQFAVITIDADTLV